MRPNASYICGCRGFRARHVWRSQHCTTIAFYEIVKKRRMTAITKNADLLGGIMEIGNNPINISENAIKISNIVCINTILWLQDGFYERCMSCSARKDTPVKSFL